MKIIIDRGKYVVMKDGEEIILPKKEFEILWLLCSVPGNVFSRKQIFSKVWGNNSSAKPRTVDVHIVKLRKKLGTQLIRTLKGVGYKIVIEDILVKN
jgi:two-component system alkaline phosphatase synthesis response regulator PhoP